MRKKLCCAICEVGRQRKKKDNLDSTWYCLYYFKGFLFVFSVTTAGRSSLDFSLMQRFSGSEEVGLVFELLDKHCTLKVLIP